VQIDGRLAQMWTRYAFYRDDEFSHCGWEGFQLYQGDIGWQIPQLIDTSYRAHCFYPPGRQPMSHAPQPQAAQPMAGIVNREGPLFRQR